MHAILYGLPALSLVLCLWARSCNGKGPSAGCLGIGLQAVAFGLFILWWVAFAFYLGRITA